MSGKIPDGWRNYKKFGSPIRNHQIIPVKTPLSTKFHSRHPKDDFLQPDEQFTPTMLVSELRDNFHIRLSLVIDLTFTDRYYSPKELNENGVRHLKIKIPGHEVPPERLYRQFEKEVNDALSHDPDSYVAVHCTHGINRTGYLICRYLINCHGYSAEDALQAVHEARGYPIEREPYIADLRQVERSLRGKGSAQPPMGRSRRRRHHRSESRFDEGPPATACFDAPERQFVAGSHSVGSEWSYDCQPLAEPYSHTAGYRERGRRGGRGGHEGRGSYGGRASDIRDEDFVGGARYRGRGIHGDRGGYGSDRHRRDQEWTPTEYHRDGWGDPQQFHGRGIPDEGFPEQHNFHGDGSYLGRGGGPHRSQPRLDHQPAAVQSWRHHHSDAPHQPAPRPTNEHHRRRRGSRRH